MAVPSRFSPCRLPTLEGVWCSGSVSDVSSGRTLFSCFLRIDLGPLGPAPTPDFPGKSTMGVGSFGTQIGMPRLSLGSNHRSGCPNSSANSSPSSSSMGSLGGLYFSSSLVPWHLLTFATCTVMVRPPVSAGFTSSNTSAGFPMTRYGPSHPSVILPGFPSTLLLLKHHTKSPILNSFSCPLYSRAFCWNCASSGSP